MNSIPNLTGVFLIGGGPAVLAAAIAARQGGFVDAIRSVVELAHSSTAFWGEALGLARRAVNI